MCQLHVFSTINELEKQTNTYSKVSEASAVVDFRKVSLLLTLLLTLALKSDVVGRETVMGVVFCFIGDSDDSGTKAFVVDNKEQQAPEAVRAKTAAAENFMMLEYCRSAMSLVELS